MLQIVQKSRVCFVKSATLGVRRRETPDAHPCVPVSGHWLRCILCCLHCTFGNGKLWPKTSKHTRMGHLQCFECGLCHAVLWRKPRFLWMGKDTSCFALFHSVSKDELALLSQNLCGFNDPNKTQFAHMVDSTAGITLLNSQKALKRKHIWQGRKCCTHEGCVMLQVQYARIETSVLQWAQNCWYGECFTN